MAFFVAIVGVLQIVVGVLVWLSAKSAIHEILGAISFGLGFLCLSLSALLVRTDDQLKAQQETNRLLSQISAAFDRIGR